MVLVSGLERSCRTRVVCSGQFKVAQKACLAPTEQDVACRRKSMNTFLPAQPCAVSGTAHLSARQGVVPKVVYPAQHVDEKANPGLEPLNTAALLLNQ